MADTSTLELRNAKHLPELQTPDTLIAKNPKSNLNACVEEDIISNADKNQEYIKPQNPKQRSLIKNFQQQTLPGWYFTPTVKGSMICTGFCWLVLIILGTINVVVTSNLSEYIYEYPANCTHSLNCTLKVHFDDDIEGPVFFYYGIKYFYQNHREYFLLSSNLVISFSYVKSISWDQIRGKKVASSTLNTKCTTVTKMKDVSSAPGFSFSGYYVEAEKPANPCGLIAKSFFNDSYVFRNASNISIDLETNNLVFSSYRDNAFKRDVNYHKTQYIDVTDEHFMAWVQFSSTSYWYKLWGRIPHTLSKGDYYLTIYNNYNVSKFGGIKTVNFSNSSVFGGRNRLLGCFLIVFGGIYFLGFLYIFKNRNNLSNEVDLNFDWKK